MARRLLYLTPRFWPLKMVKSCLVKLGRHIQCHVLSSDTINEADIVSFGYISLEEMKVTSVEKEFSHEIYDSIAMTATIRWNFNKCSRIMFTLRSIKINVLHGFCSYLFTNLAWLISSKAELCLLYSLFSFIFSNILVSATGLVKQIMLPLFHIHGIVGDTTYFHSPKLISIRKNNNKKKIN